MTNVPHDLYRRFICRVDKTSHPGGCWIWTGTIGKDGYGFLWTSINDAKPRNHGAHRLSYLIFNDDIAESLIICHRCDNPPCVNPEHLFAGTPKANSEDMVAKGRANAPFGSGHHLSKITETDVQYIRKMIADGFSQRSIARMYGISQTAVYYIRTKKTWKHVK